MAVTSFNFRVFHLNNNQTGLNCTRNILISNAPVDTYFLTTLLGKAPALMGKWRLFKKVRVEGT